MAQPLIALLSTVLPADPRGGAPRAFQDILGSNLLLRQLAQIRALGIQHCIVAVESDSGALEAAIARAELNGMHIDIVKSPRQCAELIDAQQDVLLLGDGIFADPSLLRELTGYGRPFIAVVDDSPEMAAHERIDINHLWAGIARIPGAIARRIGELPDDWNVESALLRYAAQAGLARQRIAQSSLDRQALLLINDRQSLQDARSLLLHGTGRGRLMLSERLILDTLGDMSLPYLSALDGWKRAGFMMIPVVGGLLSLIFAYAGWTIALCIAGLLTLTMQYLFEREQRCLPFSGTRLSAWPIGPASVAAAFVLHALNSAAMSAELLGVAVAGGLMMTARLDWNSDSSPRLWPDPPVALALLGAGAMTGLYVWAIWTLALLLLALAIARAWGRSAKSTMAG